MANRRKSVPALAQHSEVSTELEQTPTESITSFLPELPSYLESGLSSLSDDTDKSYTKPFTAELKQAFIRRYSANGGLFGKTCEDLDLEINTVKRHFDKDSLWTRQLKRAKLSLGEATMQVGYARSLDPNGVVDRMFQLQKRFFPAAYGDNRSQVNIGLMVNLSTPTSSVPPAA